MAEITATFPSLTFGHRGVQTRDDFVQTQEAGQDTLSGSWATAAALFKTETNAVKVEVNASRDTVVAKEALVSTHYAAIDGVYANIADINAINDTILPNIAEILLVDTNAATASAAATVAVAAANYKGLWVAGYATTGYSTGMSVGFTDGLNYISNINNNLATPVTKTNTAEWNWIEAIDPSTIYTKGEADTLLNAKLALSGGTMTGALNATEIDKGTISTGTVTFTQSAGNVQRLQVGGALTIALNGWATSGIFADILLRLVNAGSATVALPTINWIKPDGTLTTTFSTYLTAIARPALQTSGVDFMYLFTLDAGTTVYGKLL